MGSRKKRRIRRRGEWRGEYIHIYTCPPSLPRHPPSLPLRFLFLFLTKQAMFLETQHPLLVSVAGHSLTLFGARGFRFDMIMGSIKRVPGRINLVETCYNINVTVTGYVFKVSELRFARYVYPASISPTNHNTNHKTRKLQSIYSVLVHGQVMHKNRTRCLLTLLSLLAA